MDHDSPTPATAPQPRLLRHTIWNRDLLREVPERFRPLFTVLLPAAYALLLLFGLLGTLAQAPGAVAVVTTNAYSSAWTVLVAGFALVSLLALVFRLQRVELFSALLLSVILTTYPIALVAVGINTDNFRSIALAAALVSLPILAAWRVVDLIRLARRRDA